MVALDPVPRPALVRRRHVDRRTPIRPDHPEGSGRPVAEDSFRTRSKYSCHPAPLAGEDPMPQRVDPWMDRVQTSISFPSADCARLEADPEKLIPRHHPVLPLRKMTQSLTQFARPRQCPHIGLCCGLAGGHGGVRVRVARFRPSARLGRWRLCRRLRNICPRNGPWERLRRRLTGAGGASSSRTLRRRFSARDGPRLG